MLSAKLLLRILPLDLIKCILRSERQTQIQLWWAEYLHLKKTVNMFLIRCVISLQFIFSLDGNSDWEGLCPLCTGCCMRFLKRKENQHGAHVQRQIKERTIEKHRSGTRASPVHQPAWHPSAWAGPWAPHFPSSHNAPGILWSGHAVCWARASAMWL